MTIGALQLFRRLKLGWLYRDNIGIVSGLDAITDQETTSVTRRRRGRKRLVIEEAGDLMEQNVTDNYYNLHISRNRVARATDCLGRDARRGTKHLMQTQVLLPGSLTDKLSKLSNLQNGRGVSMGGL